MKRKWGVRCWYWREGIDRSEDEDIDVQQEQQWRDVPNEGLADHWGRKMAADPRATSPGLYDVMRTRPDSTEPDGYRWEVWREVRP